MAATKGVNFDMIRRFRVADYVTLSNGTQDPKMTSSPFAKANENSVACCGGKKKPLGKRVCTIND
jgi:hypothetical protein